MHHLQPFLRLVNHPTLNHDFELLVFVIVGGVALYVMYRVRIESIVVWGIILEIFAGNWKYIPFPLPLDRIVLAGAIALLLLRGTKSVGTKRIVFRPAHFLLLGLATYVFCNGLWFGTILGSYGFFTWLDRLGVIPFILFTLAPVLFGNERQRDRLLVGMTLLGLYLGWTAAAEMAGLKALVIPHYITNSAIGYQARRARGPFLESDAMGLALFDCGVFAALAAHRTKGTVLSRYCMGVAALDGVGIFLTLTRASWLGAVLGTLSAALWYPTLRRKLVRFLPLVLVAIAAAYFGVPGLATRVTQRIDTTSSVWDRYNTNVAALHAVAAHPIFGIGWQTFETKGVYYFHQATSYPLTGVGLEVHNVFLSHLAELGVPAALCWITALFSTSGGAILRNGPPELRAWRVALLAIFVMFLVEANLAPLSYPFPNLVMWLMAGVVGSEFYGTARADNQIRAVERGIALVAV